MNLNDSRCKNLTLREKSPNTFYEFSLVQIQEKADQKKLRIWTLFTKRKVKDGSKTLHSGIWRQRLS